MGNETVIAIAHQKGGVGKSTSAALLAAEIAELRPDWTVLLEDLDPYRHLTERWPGDTLTLRLVEESQSVGGSSPDRHGSWRHAGVHRGARACRLRGRASPTRANVCPGTWTVRGSAQARAGGTRRCANPGQLNPDPHRHRPRPSSDARGNRGVRDRPGALGWDVEDLEEVQREYRLKSTDNPVDYALSILRTPRLFVEAKALGGNLNDRRWANQIMGYAAVAGVEWVILTNGDEYRIYNSHATVPVEEKVFRTIRITDEGSRADDTLAVLSKERMKENWIDVLWKAHFVDRQIRAALEELFSPAPDPSLVRLLGKRVTTLSPGEIKSGLGRVRVRLDFPEETPPDRPPAPVPAPRPAPLSERRRAPTSPKAQGGPHGEATPWRNVSVQDLIAAGLIKPPLHLEKTYKGRRATGRLEADGRVTYDGKTFDSLSVAAGVARASVIGAPPGRKYPQTNGWTFWRFKDANGELKPVDCLRQRHFQSG